MELQPVPAFSAFMTQAQVDSLRWMASATQVTQPYDTKFVIGEQVVLWLFSGIEATKVTAIVVGIRFGESGSKVCAVYDLAIPTQQNGVHFVLSNTTVHLSKADTLLPEHPYDAWPLEVVEDRSPPIRRAQLSLVK